MITRINSAVLEDLPVLLLLYSNWKKLISILNGILAWVAFFESNFFDNNTTHNYLKEIITKFYCLEQNKSINFQYLRNYLVCNYFPVSRFHNFNVLSRMRIQYICHRCKCRYPECLRNVWKYSSVFCIIHDDYPKIILISSFLLPSLPLWLHCEAWNLINIEGKSNKNVSSKFWTCFLPIRVFF